MKNIEIRLASVDDAKDILKIYDYYVVNTAVSFEYDTPLIDDFKSRIKKTLERYPYYIAVIDNKIAGYAYAGSFVGREAYRFSAELTVYVDKYFKRYGIGSLLYQTLENKLKDTGITNLYACIAVPDKADKYLNFDSVKFHECLGFKQCGNFHHCGYKFNRWYNMVWMEKIIST